MESTTAIAATDMETIDSLDNYHQSYQSYNPFTDLGTILTALFYGSAFILGTIGNGLIIYIVAHYPRMRTLSNVFLASLAIADLLLVCVCIPVKFMQLITYTWTFGAVMCKAIHYVQSLSMYCSVLTLTIISVERYYAIIHPVQCRATFSMRHIRKMICVTWVLSAILATPTLGVYMLERIGVEYKTDHFWCVRIGTEWATGPEIRQRWYETRVIYELYQTVTILVLPTMIMTYTYARICTHLWTVFHHRTAMRFGHVCHLISHQSGSTNTGSSTTTVVTSMSGPPFGSSVTSSSSTSTTTARTSQAMMVAADSEPANQINHPPPSTPTSEMSIGSLSTRRHSRCQCYQQMKPNEEDNQTVKQVIKMLVAVVVLFVLCWAPNLVIGLLRAFHAIEETNEGILREIITVTFLLSYLNSVINPIIYGFMSKNFRLYFRLIFNQCWSVITTGRYSLKDDHDHRHHQHHHHHHRHRNQPGGQTAPRRATPHPPLANANVADLGEGFHVMDLGVQTKIPTKPSAVQHQETAEEELELEPASACLEPHPQNPGDFEQFVVVDL